ncbi:formimidoylglutamase [Mobilicoccus pelagius]|uniref:Formimidoylglutamase n=1 Tax=Mobilicoccus pelagius NBRC 104925 TaxID=1089455 RepID=H5URZ3_9MICO|nr:formimidoylglutamase [Mobilicoccus pelagius]GAB48501.1 formimidoylglutamase [Mobilicoccus pelagius NBRC 104925]
MSTRTYEDSTWQGRDDGDGAEHRRWHQQVRRTMSSSSADAAEPLDGAVTVIGFASDEGVRRNGGRQGAAEAPDALRRALAPLALHTDVPLRDAGTVVVDGEDLESGHDALGDAIARELDTAGTRFVVVLGGGHETAYASYLGRTRAARLEGARVGVLNLDAHFDLREADRPTSGTPFLQMAEGDARADRTFDYTVVGIAEPSNTRVLFDTADRLGVPYVVDTDAQPSRLDGVLRTVDEMLERVDAVHLSIDLDVLPAAVAPGVSAPAAYGVPVEVLDAICRRVAGSGKLAILDIVELCPRLDVDGRTAKTAARLVTTCVHAAAD